MNRPSLVEFYVGTRMIAYVESGAVPRKGEMVSIKGASYRVQFVSWALDHNDTIHKQLCATVSLVPENSSDEAQS